MDTKTLIDEYCQVTGRPVFTITVDEFIKLKQVSTVATLNPLPMTKTPVVKQPEPHTATIQAIPEHVAKVQPRVVGNPIDASINSVPTKATNTNIALEMLKSIKG